MCLLILAYKCREDYPLIIAANRDEFYERPTLPLDYWPERKNILAGRDLRGRGTWMGLGGNGRLAAITNFRDPSRHQPDAPSRGNLVSDYIGGHTAADGYLERLSRDGRRYNGFNLVVGRIEALYYYGNHGPQPREIKPGIHGLSNHLLNTPWPKVERARNAMAEIVRQTHRPDPEALMALLQDRHMPPDENLPDTGIDLDWERLLATAFIQSPTYGTRASSVLRVAADGSTLFLERTFEPDGRARTRQFRRQIPV
ncbi:MAG: NRDE family protein [Desulfosarcina sp.]|nr:NRDE family protein [Desulfobacterales bacterium]